MTDQTQSRLSALKSAMIARGHTDATIYMRVYPGSATVFLETHGQSAFGEDYWQSGFKSCEGKTVDQALTYAEFAVSAMRVAAQETSEAA